MHVLPSLLCLLSYGIALDFGYPVGLPWNDCHVTIYSRIMRHDFNRHLNRAHILIFISSIFFDVILNSDAR